MMSTTSSHHAQQQPISMYEPSYYSSDCYGDGILDEMFDAYLETLDDGAFLTSHATAMTTPTSSDDASTFSAGATATASSETKRMKMTILPGLVPNPLTAAAGKMQQQQQQQQQQQSAPFVAIFPGPAPTSNTMSGLPLLPPIRSRSTTTEAIAVTSTTPVCISPTHSKKSICKKSPAAFLKSKKSKIAVTKPKSKTTKPKKSTTTTTNKKKRKLTTTNNNNEDKEDIIVVASSEHPCMLTSSSHDMSTINDDNVAKDKAAKLVDDLSEEELELMRRTRNRQHAKKSRLRKKCLTKNLEQSLIDLKEENATLQMYLDKRFGRKETKNMVLNRRIELTTQAQAVAAAATTTSETSITTTTKTFLNLFLKTPKHRVLDQETINFLQSLNHQEHHPESRNVIPSISEDGSCCSDNGSSDDDTTIVCPN